MEIRLFMLAMTFAFLLTFLTALFMYYHYTSG